LHRKDHLDPGIAIFRHGSERNILAGRADAEFQAAGVGISGICHIVVIPELKLVVGFRTHVHSLADNKVYWLVIAIPSTILMRKATKRWKLEDSSGKPRQKAQELNLQTGADIIVATPIDV
jgi:hypothetical protein